SVHQNRSGAGGEGAATTHGSPAFVKKRAARLPVTAAPARPVLTGSAAGLAIVRPSTARCARAQDEELFSMPSTMYLILSSAEAKPRRVSKDACCRCNHRRAGEPHNGKNVIPGRRTAASPESIFQRPVSMDSGPRPAADP